MYNKSVFLFFFWIAFMETIQTAKAFFVLLNSVYKY